MKKRIKLTESETGLEFLDTPTKKDITEEYIDKFMAISKRISDFANSNDFKQKDIADKLNMHESQLSKWFSGDHNLTLSSLLKLECACNIGILNPTIWESQKQDTSLSNRCNVVGMSSYKASVSKKLEASSETQNYFYFIKRSESTGIKESFIASK